MTVTLALATLLAAGGLPVGADRAFTNGLAMAAKRPAVKVVAFGDSLTSGYRLPKPDAYPALLEKKLDEDGFDATVLNHGRDGDTSAGGVNRLRAALREKSDILIVAFGANDGLRSLPVSDVRANLKKIIETAQSQSVAVLLVGMEALPIRGWQYTLDFRNMFTSLAAEYKVPLVPFMLNGVLGNPDLMTSDGIHPNAAGAKIIASTIWSALRPMAESLARAE
jgi:acyl-CoA thioesterase-1